MSAVAVSIPRSPPAKRTREGGRSIGSTSVSTNSIPVSPDRFTLEQALRAQKQPTVREVNALCTYFSDLRAPASQNN